MSKILKFGNVILCEHAVRGAEGRHTLVNVISGDILLSEFPASIYMGAFIEYAAQRDTPYDLLIEFSVEGKLLAKITAEIDSQISQDLGIITVPIFHVKVAKPTVFEVHAQADGFSRKKIAKKKIDIREDSDPPMMDR